MFLLLIIIIHDDNNNSNNNEFCLIYDIYVYIYILYNYRSWIHFVIFCWYFPVAPDHIFRGPEDFIFKNLDEEDGNAAVWSVTVHGGPRGVLFLFWYPHGSVISWDVVDLCWFFPGIIWNSPGFLRTPPSNHVQTSSMKYRPSFASQEIMFFCRSIYGKPSFSSWKHVNLQMCQPTGLRNDFSSPCWAVPFFFVPGIHKCIYPLGELATC